MSDSKLNMRPFIKLDLENEAKPLLEVLNNVENALKVIPDIRDGIVQGKAVLRKSIQDAESIRKKMAWANGGGDGSSDSEKT